MRRCINPMCFQSGSSDAGPPEYVSNCAVECAECGEEIDLDEDVYHRNDDEDTICEGCWIELREKEEDDEGDT